MAQQGLLPDSAAAPDTLVDLLTGPPLSLRVSAVLRSAWYLADEHGRVRLCLIGPDAVRLPFAVVVPRWPPGRATAGAPATAGRGVVRIGEVRVRIVRWWRPPRPAGLDLRRIVAHVPASGSAPVLDVAALLGRGPGLTPDGDDILAGALVTLRATGSTRAAPLAAAIGAAADRTTPISAALLAEAAAGRCIPELADVLTTSDRGDRVTGPWSALLRVGHSSGRSLATGVLAAARLGMS